MPCPIWVLLAVSVAPEEQKNLGMVIGSQKLRVAGGAVQRGRGGGLMRSKCFTQLVRTLPQFMAISIPQTPVGTWLWLGRRCAGSSFLESRTEKMKFGSN